MIEILYAKEKRSDYENFYATCPYCGFNNVFNRVSDLCTVLPISCKSVKCLSQECEEKFYINGDTVNKAYEMLIYDCQELFERKKYAYCILNLSQAYEVFFALFVKIKLVFEPFNIEVDSGEDLNIVLKELYDATNKCTFYPMRNIFFNIVINEVQPDTLLEAREIIKDLSKKWGSNLPRSKFEGVRNKKLKNVLDNIEASRLCDLRNDVVHKSAYRPLRAEVEQAMAETRNNIFTVSSLLGGLQDDINWYVKGST